MLSASRSNHVAQRTRNLPSRLDLQPRQNLFRVISGRESTDPEQLGDLGIRAPLRNQQRNLRLPERESAGAHDLL
jgi:hypothetical protein